jgi:hypothetical protein
MIVIDGNEIDIKMPNVAASTKYNGTSLFTGISSSELFLPQTRFLSDSHAVIELEPQKWTIVVRSGGYGQGSAKEYDIPMPWVIFVYDNVANTMKIFFRSSQLMSTEDEVCYPYLTNVKPDCKLCMTWSFPGDVKTVQNKAYFIARQFLMSHFSYGMYLWQTNYEHALPKEIVKLKLGGHGMLWIDGAKLYNWLEKKQMKTILSLDYKPAGKLKDMLMTGSPNGTLEWEMKARILRCCKPIAMAKAA